MLFTLALTSTTILLPATLLLLLLGRHVRVASRILGVIVAGSLCYGGAWAAARLWTLPTDLTWIAAGAVGVVCLLVILLLPYWNPIGQAFLGTYLGAALSYLALGTYLTAATGLSVWGRLASLVLLLLEFFALVISGYFAFEGCDRLCRARDTRRIAPPDPAYLPKVSLQVPAFNEPADMLIETVKSLERIDYPNLEILVVDNNTPDPETWRPVAEYCASRGERVRFLHVETDGFKAGALNRVMAEHLDPDVELIGVVDADYQVDPEYLKTVVGYFADPNVAFVQTPQDYRDYAGDTYLTACYDAYSYFFHASMPSRNQRNSLIFAGTMGVMRRRPLEEIGGWAEWCITEDSETSLRLFKAGYEGVYIERSMGRGIMPLTFSALKSQRFRWCFGGIQIVRRHWRDLMPLRRSGLTLGQKLDYLFGTGLVWFNDVLYLGFTVVLLATAYQIFTGQGAFFRPLLGGLVLLPAALLLTGLLRALWSLRRLTGIGVKRAVFALLNWLSMSWIVAMATLRGMVRKRAVFLRTPKEHDEHQNAWTAIRAAKAETVLAAVLWACAIGAAVKGTAFVAALLVWQGMVYASSPLMSWLSTRTVLTPELERRRRTETSRERMAALAGYYTSGAVALAAVALIAAILIIGGSRPGQVPALPEPPAGTPAPHPNRPNRTVADHRRAHPGADRIADPFPFPFADAQPHRSAADVSRTDDQPIRGGVLMRQRFARLLPAKEFAEFDAAMRRAGEVMDGRTMWHINATLAGGGVAEIMKALLPYLQEAGMETRWLAVAGRPEFLDITKRVHNWLHGFEGDSGPLGQAQRQLYDEVIAENAAKLLRVIRPGDVVFVHDPQPAGLIPSLKAHGVHAIWHCHIGTDEPNDFTRQAWRFLIDAVAPADAYIFSRAQYLWEGLDAGKLHVIRPAIDPFTHKNRELTPTEVQDILAAHWPIPAGVPTILQTGRWDRLKGPADVIDLFARYVVGDHPDAHLLVAGPSSEAVTDDPEGAGVYAECVALHEKLPPSVRARVHLLRTPMDDIRQTDLIVNALQRRADVVLQMSQAEGFGLVVAEAMWKRRPVVASRVGGIQDQIEHGRSGILIPDPTDGRAFARAAVSLLRDPERARRLGERAHERVKEHFLSSRMLTEIVRLLTSCWDRGHSIAR